MRRHLKRATMAGALACALAFGLPGPSKADNGEPWFDFYPANWTIITGSPYVNLGTLQLGVAQGSTDAVWNTTPTAIEDPESTDQCTTVDHRFNIWQAYRLDFDMVILGPQAPAGHPTDRMQVLVHDLTHHTIGVAVQSYAPGDPYLTSPYGYTLATVYGPAATYGNDLPVWTVLHETVDLTEFDGDQIQIEFLDPGSSSTIFQLSNPQLYYIGAQEDVGPCNGPWHPVPLP